MVLRVADGEVPAELLLQAGVHALLRRGGGEVEGEQEQQVGQVGQTHPHLRQPAPPSWSLPTSHISQPVSDNVGCVGERSASVLAVHVL